MAEMVAMDSLFGRDRYDDLVEVLWRTPNWPHDPERDRALIRQLATEFPRLDLVAEIGKWQTWLIGHGDKKMVTNRGRFQRVRNWCSNAVRYQRTNATRQGDPVNARQGPRAASIGGAPAPASAFSDGARLVQW